MTTHPVGLAIIGLSVAGFGLAHLAVNLRSREAWTKMASLGMALLSVALVPALYVLATGNSLAALLKSADINSHDPEPQWEHIYGLEEGSYIMHPSLVLNRVILAAFLVGLPFLLWRLAWPIPLAALLTLGWVVWEATRLVEKGLNRLGVPRGVTGFLPLVLVAALVAAAWSPAVAGTSDIHQTDKEVARVERSCFDPIFRWMGDNMTEPSVVLAPDQENTCIPAYSAAANVVSLRGRLILNVLPELERRTDGRVEVPRGVLDVWRFFHRPTWEEVVRILRRHEVDYVMVTAKSRLHGHLRSLPWFLATNSPGQRYTMYAVDHRKLDEYPGRR